MYQIFICCYPQLSASLVTSHDHQPFLVHQLSCKIIFPISSVFHISELHHPLTLDFAVNFFTTRSERRSATDHLPLTDHMEQSTGVRSRHLFRDAY